ncbi:MAG: hypothetical protein ACRD3M_06615 [Thermoanaerobaculia bacterium]
MRAVTYASPPVTQLLAGSFVCLRVDEREEAESTRELLRAYRLLWTPGFVFLDYRGGELRRLVGYRPPEDFLPELCFVLGLFETLHGRHGEAYARLREAAERRPEGPLAPEALYWAGIAAFRRDGRRFEVLRREWEQIRARYPDSAWWKRADVFDADPAAVFGSARPGQ